MKRVIILPDYRQSGAPKGKRHKSGLTLQGRYRTTTIGWFPSPILGYRIDYKGCELYEDGRLFVPIGFEWNGPSGPTFDDSFNLIPSLPHDVFYGMAHDGEYRKGKTLSKGPALFQDIEKPAVDRYFYDMLRDRARRFGWLKRQWLMFRAWAYWRAVSRFAGPHWRGVFE